MDQDDLRVRDSLRLLVTGIAAEFGYSVEALKFAEQLDLSLLREGFTFEVWIRPSTDPARAFRETKRFKVGHRNEASRPEAYRMLARLVERLAYWEGSLTDPEAGLLFEQRRSPSSGPQNPPELQALLDQARFEPLHADWLPTREQQLQRWLEALRPTAPERRVLLLNATKGLQIYGSIVDFFAHMQRVQPGVRVTSASYFEEIFQFHAGAREKGLTVVSMADALKWDASELNRYDVIVCVGVSDALVRLMAVPELRSKLVLLDFAFYHQLLETSERWRPGMMDIRVGDIQRDKAGQTNRVIGYSCQPLGKLVDDISGVCRTQLFDWRWFGYIPIGFAYAHYFRSSRYLFDAALLGSVGREYDHMDPARFHDRRLLFIGNPEHSPAIARLREQADVTVFSGAGDVAYAQLLALCRCVILPMKSSVQNVLLSVVDTIASGRPLITAPHVGLARLQQEGLPALFYDGTRASLATRFEEALGRVEELEQGTIAFGRERMDIYRVLQRLTEEHLM